MILQQEIPCGNKQEADYLARGLTRVPYWGRNKDGVRVALSCWDTLRPGETLADAATRLSVNAPETEKSSQLPARIAAHEAQQTPPLQACAQKRGQRLEEPLN